MKRIFSKVTVLLLMAASLMICGCTKEKKDSGQSSQQGVYVTKAEFEAYKEAASQTLSQLQEAISEPESAKLNKSAFEMSRQQISDAL